MVAYNFQAQFALAILSGRKRQTIRAPRQRHARPGERVQIYTGMRTKGCRKLIEPDPECVSVQQVTICDDSFGKSIIVDGVALALHEMTQFAGRDGFATLDALYDFFGPRMELGQFRGVLIRWAPAERAQERGE